MDDIAPWAAGIVMALLALSGLVVASGAVDLPFYIFGLALFLFGVACIFGLIVRHTGNQPPAPSTPGDRDAARDARAVVAGPGEGGDAMPPASRPAAAPQPAAIASRA